MFRALCVCHMCIYSLAHARKVFVHMFWKIFARATIPKRIHLFRWRRSAHFLVCHQMSFQRKSTSILHIRFIYSMLKSNLCFFVFVHYGWNGSVIHMKHKACIRCVHHQPLLGVFVQTIFETSPAVLTVS